MNKRVFIIGNDRSLQGVKIDIENYRTFLKSPFGGEWYDQEINILLNPTKKLVRDFISYYKSLNLDYLIVYFSGHGGYKRSTQFELNAAGESISEIEFQSISPRQLSIYDCCRGYEIEKVSPVTLSDSFINKAHIHTRRIYEERILQASLNQHVRLYSCGVGESSYDTPEGGLYSKNLIRSAYNQPAGEIDVFEIHRVAKIYTNYEEPTQNPEAILPKVSLNRDIIFGISIRLNS